MTFPDLPAPTDKDIADHLLQTATAKRNQRLEARLTELAELGDPVINGRTLQVDGQASPHHGIEDILVALAISRGLPDQDPDEIVIDATLEADAIPFRLEMYGLRDGVAVLRGVHMFGPRVIAIYHVAKEQCTRAMRALNEF